MPVAPSHICLVDGFYYQWELNYTKQGDVYIGMGTVDIGAGFLWNAYGSFNSSTGSFELHAINPLADDCASGYTDSFIYYGTGAGHYDNNGDVYFVSSVHGKAIAAVVYMVPEHTPW